MKILHLAPDDKKFVITTADIFDATIGLENSYRVIVENMEDARKIYAENDNICVVNDQYCGSISFKEDLASCDCLVVHYMDRLKAQAIMQAPSRLPIVWSGWGGDYYNLLPQGGNNLLGEETRRLVSELRSRTDSSSKVRRIFKNLKGVAYKIRNTTLHAPQLKRAIRRVDYFSSPFPEDFDLLRKHLGSDFNPVYTRIFYGSVERTYMPGVEKICGNNILVGNSATATNNHLEVFGMLKNVAVDDRKIVVPLSYGDMSYKEAVIKRGRELFGENFLPLVEFMPLDQYNTIIAHCAVVVMGHRRQQGGGNTFTMLYKGAKVFLDRASTVYQYLKKNGAFVYTLDELCYLGAGIFEPLTEEQRQVNREVLQRHTSNRVVMDGMRRFSRQIESHGVHSCA